MSIMFDKISWPLIRLNTFNSILAENFSEIISIGVY